MTSGLIVERAYVGWFFWLKWVLGSTVGWVVVFGLSFLAIGAVVELFLGDPETVFGEGSLAFAAVLTAVFTLSFTGAGSVQWLLLRRKLERAGWWALVNGLGGFIVAVLYFALMGVVSEATNEIIHNGVAGAVVGLLQWRILRLQVARAHLWIPATIVGFVVAGGGAAIVSAVTGLDVGTSGIFGVAAMSAMTGGVMVWLLRQPSRSEFGASAPQQAVDPNRD
jgi:hypothetical protein